MGWNRALAGAALASVLAATPACTSTYLSQSMPAGRAPGQRADAGKADESSLFRRWEPVLERMEGKPVPSQRVHFSSPAELRKKCRGDARGCLVTSGLLESIAPSRIYIDEELRFPGSDASRSIASLRCSPHDALPAEIPVLIVWLHEQGHYFGKKRDRTPESEWIGEVEAIAFAYRFAWESRIEDADLGQKLLAHMLGDLIERRDLFGSRFEKDMRQALDSSGKSMGTPTYLAHLSVFLLRNTGLKSYSEVWRFVHDNDAATVALRIRESWHLLDSKIREAKIICNGMRETLP